MTNGSSQLGEVPAWHRWLMLTALVAVGIVYARGSFDFARYNGFLPLPIPGSQATWMFFVWSAALVVANLRIAFRSPEVLAPANTWTRRALVLAIPVAFLASGLDCTGIILDGCTSVCTFLIRIWTPVVGAAAFAYMYTGRRWLLPAITVICMLYLVPSCQCANPLNAWWLHHLPRSPACFAASGWVSVIAVAALSWGKWTRTAATVCWFINITLLAFFVGHHYYHIPW
jgi:hypothetical protein